jgi:prepilin-type N-terminal cleavage/methylation domain-containing protein
MKYQIKTKNNLRHVSTLNTNQGFTLMEVMVAVSIFTIVVVVGIGALLTINNTYRKSQVDRKSIDSLSYTLESMSRRIRTATTWNNTPGMGPENHFSFVDQDGSTIDYFTALTPGTSETGIFMQVTNCTVDATTGICNVPDGSYPMTPSGVDVGGTNPGSGLWFTTSQTANGQPYVQVNVGGTVKNAQQVTDFVLQTGISKRTF